MVRVRSGDLEAYAELVHRHASTALRTAVLLGAGAESEDVVQEAFVKAHRSLGSFREGAPFRPWLLRIVANETHNQRRGAARRIERERVAAWLSPELLGARTDDPAEQTERQGTRHGMLAAVRELPEPQRLVVTCRYLLDLTEAETATVLGLPRGTVKSRLSRALDRLRTLLSDDLAEHLGGREAGHG